MSVRAYRISNDGLADPSFNIYLDQKLVSFIDNESEAGIYSYLNDYVSGDIEVPVIVLRSAIAQALHLDLTRETIARLEQDVLFAESQNSESVGYSCF